MTNISTDDGMMKLLTHLRKLKVDDKLEELGAQDGDQVILDDFVFVYYR
jgi:Obg family GTPase CgtA-like protein